MDHLDVKYQTDNSYWLFKNLTKSDMKSSPIKTPLVFDEPSSNLIKVIFLFILCFKFFLFLVIILNLEANFSDSS